NYDLLLRHWSKPLGIDPRLTLVVVDDQTISEINHYPVPASNHCLLVSGLKAAGVERMAWDFLFDTHSQSDTAFVEACATLSTFHSLATRPARFGHNRPDPSGDLVQTLDKFSIGNQFQIP